MWVRKLYTLPPYGNAICCLGVFYVDPSPSVGLRPGLFRARPTSDVTEPFDFRNKTEKTGLVEKRYKPKTFEQLKGRSIFTEDNGDYFLAIREHGLFFRYGSVQCSGNSFNKETGFFSSFPHKKHFSFLNNFKPVSIQFITLISLIRHCCFAFKV